MMNSELTESLTGGPSDDGASISSQRSTASLLQRIQMQRNREVQQQQQQQMPTQQIQVPQYNPNAVEQNFAGGGPAPPETEGSGFFSTAWNNISSSMENGMASSTFNDGMGADEALLMPSADENAQDYSMSNYFLTFVRDINRLFYSLPVPARVVVVVVLLYVALKLL